MSSSVIHLYSLMVRKTFVTVAGSTEPVARFPPSIGCSQKTVEQHIEKQESWSLTEGSGSFSVIGDLRIRVPRSVCIAYTGFWDFIYFFHCVVWQLRGGGSGGVKQPQPCFRRIEEFALLCVCWREGVIMGGKHLWFFRDR